MVLMSVSGSASRTMRPERAQVLVGVSVDGADRAEVVSRALQVHNELTADAAALRAGGVVATWSADQVGVWPYREQSRAETPAATRYRAASTLQLRFIDFEALSQWLAEIGERDGVVINQISWELTTPVRSRVLAETRQAALQDASSRARDYARTLGVSEPVLQAIYEPGLRPGVIAEAPLAPAMFARAVGSEGGRFTLSPEDVVIEAALSADFRID